MKLIFSFSIVFLITTQVKSQNNQTIIDKIIHTYQNLKSYQGNGILTNKMFAQNTGDTTKANGNFKVYYQTGKLKFTSNHKNEFFSKKFKLLKPNQKDEISIQEFSNGEKMYVKPKKISSKFVIALVDAYHAFTIGLFIGNRHHFLKNKKYKLTRIKDATFNNVSCYRFRQTTYIKDGFTPISDISFIEKFIEWFDFVPNTQKRIRNYLKESTKEPPISFPKNISIKNTYWFRKDNYLLVKSEIKNSSNQYKSETTLIYNPIINQKIDEGKFVWNKTKKK